MGSNDVTEQIRDKSQHTCKSDAFENGLSPKHVSNQCLFIRLISALLRYNMYIYIYIYIYILYYIYVM